MKFYTVITTVFALKDLKLAQKFYETYHDIARIIAILDQRQNPITHYTQLNVRA
jgi:hypothetical protein